MYSINSVRKKTYDVRKRIKKEVNRSMIVSLIDIFFCRFKYKINLREYDLYKFHLLSKYARENYLGWHEMNEIRSPMIKNSPVEYFQDKDKFNEKFNEFIGREWLFAKQSTDEEIISFVKKHDKVIIKPTNLGQGVGISIKYFSDIDDEKRFCKQLREDEILIEELIVQHKELARINPNSVNTIRISTILDKSSSVHIISSVLRCSADKKSIDNLSAGGIVISVDSETGITTSFTRDSNFKNYTKHPYTNVILAGIQLPMWDQAIDMVKKAAIKIPSFKIIGWDVAITDKGPLLVEGNHQAGPQIMQFGTTGIRRTIYRYLDKQ